MPLSGLSLPLPSASLGHWRSSLPRLPSCSSGRTSVAPHLSLPCMSSLGPSAGGGARGSRRSPPACCTSSSPMSVEASVSPTSPTQDSLTSARAYWVSSDVVAWNVNGDKTLCYLYASKGANLYLADTVVEGYDVKIQLKPDDIGLPTNVTKKFPHILGYKTFKAPSSADVMNLLKCQLAIATYNADGKCSDVTSLQLPGVLDDMFAYTGPLGAMFNEQSVTLHLWAPTAQMVHVLIYEDPTCDEPLVRLQLEEVNGVWRVEGSRCWEGCYYVYEISVYHPQTLKVETYLVNDPYARGLSSDGRRTLLVNLDCGTLKPDGWDTLADEKPELQSFSDISIYELHIRDFSIIDHTVDPDYRGGYLAFTSQDSAGVRHLRELSTAGLTHVHLLPSFHFAAVDDNKNNWACVDFEKLAKLPPDSDQQQSVIMAIKDEDGYNWGYNPVLWGVPKGSYASNSGGPCRSLEFRKMVQALNRIGLRVVMDVVYNHLHASGPLDENSVLDKVVPGYYLRRSNDGSIEHSTCINNTASEHFMVERLILDDLMCWAVEYKVDGFRFDLMGHIMKSTMVKAKCALQSLTKDLNGVDGSKIYIYGEGWDFGEVAKNSRGINASQFNICGTGIGSFNDRIRDAVIGGSPFGHPLQQGFATGLCLQPNEHDHGSKPVMDETLAILKDHIQVGLAANLRDYVFTSYCGQAIKGSEVLRHDGTPVAYALSPIETLLPDDKERLMTTLGFTGIPVNYVSAHDNETLFDIVSLKTPFKLSVDERCRLNYLATSIVALSQGIPFFHAGDEMLRSKSLDRDSYNSGDWFNRLDFTYECNNWGVGLPPKEKNEKNWPLIEPRLANSAFKPLKRHIVAAVDNFKDLLKIRYSSPLFRLKMANAIQERVRFLNTGPSWIPGVIVMSIQDGFEGIPGLIQMDPLFSFIVVIFNASPNEASFASPVIKARNLQLHPIQRMSSDVIVKNSTYETFSGTFTVPPRTTAVFVETRGI